MILKEQAAKWAGWNIEIIATDICTKVLEKAKKGVYSQFEVQRGLPIQMMMKYFEQKGELWQISDEIRRMVKYDYLNLLEPINKLGTFDVVFCRNVLIYFDQGTKGEVLDRQVKQMENDAVLYLGAAETVLGISSEFKPVRGQRGMYVPKDAEGNLYSPT
jgi:chemotaxis protein methyltransferase CheR